MPILRKFKQQMGFLGIMIVIRQGLLVYAQYLNAETFNFLLAKNWNGFFGVILQITLTWAIIIALDRYKVVYEMKVAQDIGIVIRMDVASHIRDMNMTIMVNNKYLIKGRSGAGKSSIFNLMLGYLKPDNGTVDFMGHDVSQLSSKTIANEVIYLVQDPFIFSGTIQDNLQMGDDYPKTQLIEVLDQVGFENPSDWLIRDVGNQGSELSGGQKQRIAIARALLRQPKVLLLDEVTSALDKESAINIEQRLLTMNNITIVVISHVLHQEVQPFYDSIYDIA